MEPVNTALLSLLLVALLTLPCIVFAAVKDVRAARAKEAARRQEEAARQREEVARWEAEDARRREIIARREAYAASVSPTARIIVNNGTEFFFMDDERQSFGLAENGQTYAFAELKGFMVFNDRLRLSFPDKEIPVAASGFCYTKDMDVPFGASSLNAVAAALLPVLRENVHAELAKRGYTSTHEYEQGWSIWGCDLNAEVFYRAGSALHIYRFPALRRVTITTRADGGCTVTVTVLFCDVEVLWPICFSVKDETFYQLLSMFKGIRNRVLGKL